MEVNRPRHDAPNLPYLYIDGRSSIFVENFKLSYTRVCWQSQTKASDVFVSYCWANSQHALDRGQSRKVDGAIGAKDPRYIKELLEEEGLSCWIDIEKAGPVICFTHPDLVY